MSEPLFTSDSHFSHGNIMKFARETRRGETVEEMDELMIDTWNSQVGPDTVVYHTGDFSFAKHDRTKEIISRLNGKIHLITGNHDTVIKESYELQSMFASVSVEKIVKVGKVTMALHHFPQVEWHNCHYGWYQLHGHTHGGLSFPGYRSMDIGVDARDDNSMRLWYFEEIVERLKDRPPLAHFGKRVVTITPIKED